MAHQQSPRIRQLAVKLTQGTYRQLEKEAKFHRFTISEYVRFLINEATLNTTLTKEDNEIIHSRIEAATRRIYKKMSGSNGA